MFKYFNDCDTLEDVKKKYKELALKLHPDVSGRDTTSEFQDMLNEYEIAFNKYKNVCKDVKGQTYYKETSETANQYKDVIEKLLHMNGVVIEIIGTFLWLSGNTFQYKDVIKNLGFRYAAKKKMWYKSPDGYKRKARIDRKIEEIRDYFGSSVISNDNENKTKQIPEPITDK